MGREGARLATRMDSTYAWQKASPKAKSATVSLEILGGDTSLFEGFEGGVFSDGFGCDPAHLRSSFRYDICMPLWFYI